MKKELIAFVLQVCEEDLRGGDHPLRVLSEENLTCASNFTGKKEIE